MEELKIVQQLRAIIQAEVTKNFGYGRPTLHGMEAAKEYAQKLLDTYMKGIIKESPELQKQWVLGHPFLIHVKLSVKTRHYEVVITTKDNPKDL